MSENTSCIKCGHTLDQHDYVHGVRGNCGKFTAQEPMTDHARGCQGREYTCTCGYDDQREWHFDMDAAPTDRIVNVVGRYLDATSGFPRYAGFMDGQWFEYSRFEPQPLVVWAWREREDWPREHPPKPLHTGS